MDRINQHIAKKLIDLLPEDEEYYKLGELRQLGFPTFVVKRMQVELERNLAESIVPPKTDWANMQTDAVQNAWDQFIGAIRAEARLPASYAHSVVETAIDDIMDMLIQPRKNLPEVIFGASDELSHEEVLQRMDSIVVYRHFATLIPKYMEKKGLKKFGRERCAQLIEKADEKLTKHYTPLNWAQMLEPLFNLLDEQIDSNLLRLFFEDKKMPRIARSFDLMNKSLNRAQLIEVLSSPELLNVEGYDEEQSELFQEEQQADTGLEGLVTPSEAEAEAEEPPSKSKQKKRENKPTKEREQKKEAESPSLQDQEEEDPGSILSKFHEGREKAGAGSGQERDNPFHIVFGDLGQIEEEGEEMEKEEQQERRQKKGKEKRQKSTGEEEEGTPLNEIFSEETGLSIENREETGKEGTGDSPLIAEENADEGSPIWQRFMSPEERDKAERQQEEEIEEEGVDEEGFIEEPVIDLTKKEGPDESDVKRLKELLDDERERFVEEIFRGADEAYEEAVRHIATIDKWQEASKFIEREVFKRNLVDMYSESAVDFTDRLQTYYIEKNKSQS